MAVTKILDTWKLKKWWPVFAPKYLNSKKIGETPASEIENIIGRKIDVSLAVVTDDIRKQNINSKFKIIGIEGNNAISELVKYEISPASIKRHIKKGRARIDDSFICKTADNKNIIIKPFIVTKSNINRSQETAIRKITKTTINEAVSSMSYQQFVQDLISQKIQKTILNAIKKIAPPKVCEIRVMELIEEGTKEISEKAEEGEKISETMKEVKTEVEQPIENKKEASSKETKEKQKQEKKEEEKKEVSAEESSEKKKGRKKKEEKE